MVNPVNDVPDGEGNTNDEGSNHNHKSCYHQSSGVLISTGHNKCLQLHTFHFMSSSMLTYRNGKTEGNQSEWPTEATSN